jgi:hypothetical protein
MTDLQAATAAYSPSDDFFGTPFIDVDEERAEPIPHRYAHGGFDGTDTLYSMYFPPEAGKRMLQFIGGGYGGDEHSATGIPFTLAEGHHGLIGFAASRGAYLVESNQGHKGAETCPKAGDDGTIYNYRAEAETARLARVLGAAVYGTTPERAYVLGGSGGGARTKSCIEYVDDAWDAGVSFVAGGSMTLRNFSAMNNAKRLLGPQVAQVADATDVGGSGDPFAGLSTSQREALADLYAAGFHRGAERNLFDDLGLGFMLWTWQADHLVAKHRDYFEAFWSTTGHAGADGVLDAALLDVKTTVAGTVGKAQAASYPLSLIQSIQIQAFGDDDSQVGILLEDDAPETMIGCRIQIQSGAAAGRQLYCFGVAGPLLVASSIGEAQELRFNGVQPGDEVHIDNRDYLAYCYYYRHHVTSPEEIRRFSVDGNSIYPHYDFDDTLAYGPPMSGIKTVGKIRRPLFLIQHTYDTSCWLLDGVRYDAQVRDQLGDDAEGQWRMWLMDNAEHMTSAMLPSSGEAPVPSTRLINYGGSFEAGVDFMIGWIERGENPPDPTSYRFDTFDNRVALAAAASERCGIQPVATATANGSSRAEVTVGDEVRLELTAEAPPGVGAIIEWAWDFDGTGTWPEQHTDVAPSVQHQTTHRYTEPGTYFVSARVTSQAQGNPADPYSRIENLGRCRVVVTAAEGH